MNDLDGHEELPKLPPGSDTISKDDLYREMDAVGNTYGPAFAGLHSITMASDALQASSSFEVLDIQASMPDKHQRPHVIYPSTLDIVFHTALPLVGLRLGPGSDELLISASQSLQKPASELDISTLLTSSHFPTAVSDMSVLAGGHRVLGISGMEFRSLASHPGNVKDPHGTADNAREICYRLDWQTDIDYMRAEDLPETPASADLIAQITSKHYGLSIIGLGTSIDLSEEVLHAVVAHNRVTSYGFVDATPGRFDDAAERLEGFPVQFRTLLPGTNPLKRGFQAGAYDLVLVASSKWLSQAAVLVKPGGTIVLVLNVRDSRDDTWRDTLHGTPTLLEEQLSFRDSTEGKLVVLARPAITQLPAKIHILTHSTHNAPAWVSAIKSGLSARNASISIDTLSPSNIKELYSGGSGSGSEDTTVIIVDDQPGLPILTDSHCFDTTTTLLRQPTRNVWISPDDPAPFHQIEGVARTAHAENDDLRLTAVHVAPGLLADESGYVRLVDIVAGAVSQVANPNIPHTEREKRIRENGTVVVPRLHRSEELNNAIAGDSNSGPETEPHQFTDGQRPLVLSPDESALFVDYDRVYAMPLADDAIDIEAQAVVLTKAGLTAPLGEYAGIVTHVGANVKSLRPGDRVIALAPIVGASRLRIPHGHASHIPPGVPFTAASALLLISMAASYALHGVAHLLSSDGTVLVHGALTAAGRAAVAVAQSIGVRVTATAADTAEARLLKKQMSINAADVLVARPSLHRRLPRDVFPDGLDAVVQAGENGIPAEILAHIKPFGCVVAVGNPSGVSTMGLPPMWPFTPSISRGSCRPVPA